MSHEKPKNHVSFRSNHNQNRAKERKVRDKVNRELTDSEVAELMRIRARLQNDYRIRPKERSFEELKNLLKEKDAERQQEIIHNERERPSQRIKSNSSTRINSTESKRATASNKERVIDTKNHELVLVEHQVKQLIKTGSENTIARILNSSSITLSEVDRKSLQDRLLEFQLKQAPNQTIRTAFIETKVRTVQSKFRQLGLQYYSQCVVTGISLYAVLDAAHIQPANGENDSLDNCLILRKDLHKLFDDGLWTIHPESHSIVLSRCLRQIPEYDKYHGKILTICARKEFLIEHFAYVHELHKFNREYEYGSK
ncbi:HNH endonuclease [Vibrio parahaemolyticus]|nr:HNH endonuclease [Vibrio parahaemolyticus]